MVSMNREVHSDGEGSQNNLPAARLVVGGESRRSQLGACSAGLFLTRRRGGTRTRARSSPATVPVRLRFAALSFSAADGAM